MTAAQPLRIDFVSDVACPWCVIGLGNLRRAIEASGVHAEIHLQPFELNPEMPPEGENASEHVAKKYGSTRERSDGVRQVLSEHGAAVGFAFNYNPESRIWNTFDAHRLLHWAGHEGASKQLALKEALFKLNFTDQRSTSDHAALLDAVREARLDPILAAAILSSDEFSADVRGAEQMWMRNGINAVPSVIFNQRWVLQGAQPAEVFEQAIRDIASGAAKEA